MLPLPYLHLPHPTTTTTSVPINDNNINDTQLATNSSKMDTKNETTQPTQADASLPSYSQYAEQYDAPRQQAVPVYRRAGFVRRALFLIVCLFVLALMFIGLVFAVDFYKNANHNPGSTDPNMSPAQPTLAGQARGADVVARQIDHPSLKMFACPNVPGLSCGWGQACSPNGCIDLHVNRRNNQGAAAESSEPMSYTTTTSTENPTEYSPTPTSWTAPITLPTNWGITYPTSFPPPATAPDDGTETSPTGYDSSSSTTGTEDIVPTETSTTSTETPAESPTEGPENPENPDSPNAALRLGGDTYVASAAAWTLAMALVGMLL